MIIILFMLLFRYIDGGPPAGEPDMSSSIWRRYSEFELLRNYLVAYYPAVRKQKQTFNFQGRHKRSHFPYTFEPQLSVPQLSGFLDYLDLFFSPNFVTTIY